MLGGTTVVAPLPGSTQQRCCMKRASRAGPNLWRCLMDVIYSAAVASTATKDGRGVPYAYRGTRAREGDSHSRTMTADLLALADWLRSAGCTHVAMESTGSTGARSTISWKAM